MDNIEKCIICGSKNHQDLFSAIDREFLSKDIFRIRECKNCKLKWTNPQPTMEYLQDKAYPENYEPYLIKTDKSGSLKENLKKTFMFKIFSRYLDSKSTWIPVLPKGSKVLELGCSNGKFLNSLKKYDWELYGVDIAEKPIQFAKDYFGLSNVYCSSLPEMKFPDNYFDFIYGWNVIEHFQYPKSVINEVNRILKPGGYLALSSPNADSLEFLLFKEYYRYLEVPRHLFHFSPKTLSQLCSNLGFKTRRIIFHRTATDAVGSVGLLLRDKYNIKNKIVNYIFRFSSRPNRILQAFLKPYGYIAAFFKFSCRITIVAEKKSNTWI